MLALGSVVYLKDGRQKLIIISRGPIVKLDQELEYFDYGASLYPLGFNAEQVFYFNQENIDRIIFEGYRDEDEARFQELYDNWLKEEGVRYSKGKVRSPR